MTRAVLGLALLVGSGVGSGLGGASALAAPPSLSWERVFGAPATRPGVSLRARVWDGQGASRSFELWREGERRLKRLGEEGREVRAELRAGEAVHDFTVIDHPEGTFRRVPAEKAARLGPAFTWWTQAHLWELPAPRYRLERLPGPAVKWGGARCEWYLVTPDGVPGTRVCWSREFAVPLRIDEPRDGGWWTRLSVESIGPLPRGGLDWRLDTSALRERALPEPDED